MISDREKSGIEVSGNMGGKAYVAGIDDENIAHILGLFTDLYSDTIMAFVREYSTNARDAMVEAGIDGPIKITLPTMMSPFFKVRDDGVGLDESDIATIYSRYGSSTKRATNDQNGMLGLGCKSALTYTDTFTVTSVKEGVKTICVVSREGTGVPVMTVPSVRMTDEPNGTEVTVPVKQGDHSVVANRVKNLFQYWPEGSVLVNGEQPRRFDGMKLTDNLYVMQDGEVNRVVMGGVCYPVASGRIRTGLTSGYSILAFVPIGAVNFAPSREALSYDGGTVTVDTLNKLSDDIAGAIQGAVQREVNACKYPADALATVYRWNKITEQNARIKYTYKGKEVPQGFALGRTKHPIYGYDVDEYFESINPPSAYGYRTAVSRRMSLLRADEWSQTGWVTGFDLKKFTPQHRRKLVKLWEDRKLDDVRRWIIVPPQHDAKLPREWVDPKKIVAWDDIKDIKLPVTQNPGSRLNGRIPGSYDCFVNGQFTKGVEANDIDQKLPVYWIAGNRTEASYYVPLLTDRVPTHTFVMMPSNRVEKFKRNFPKAQRVRDGLTAERDKWLNSLPKDARIALAINDQGVAAELSVLDPAKVNDPDLRTAIKDASYKGLHSVIETRRMFRNVLGTDGVGEHKIDWTNPLRKYPLYTSFGFRNHPDHTYQYLNLTYKVTTKGV